MAQKLDTRLRPLHPRLAGLYSLLLLAVCFVIAVDCYATLFGGPAWLSLATASPPSGGNRPTSSLLGGPAWLCYATLLGVALASAGVFLVVTGRRPADPRGLSGTFPWLRGLDMPLTRAGQVTAIALVVAWPTLFFASGYFVDGCVESGAPVFAPREDYRLVNHGIVTEVSRLRFLIAGLSGAVAMHAAFLGVAFFPLYTFLFGDRFHLLRDPNAQSKIAERSAAADGGREGVFSEVSSSQRGRRC